MIALLVNATGHSLWVTAGKSGRRKAGRIIAAEVKWSGRFND
jgi:hypothetical protein